MRISIVDVARVVHTANRAFCIAIGDNSQSGWDETPDNIKASAIDGVTYMIGHPQAPASASHDNWCKFKAADGWVYGETKDLVAKTHPCMVPFDSLPMEQKTKDHLLLAIVRTLTPLVELPDIIKAKELAAAPAVLAVSPDAAPALDDADDRTVEQAI